AGVNPLVHYLQFGAAEGRDPNSQFSTLWYLSRYPDVTAAGVNPLVHYLQFGTAEGRDPSPRFKTRWYLAENPDVAACGVNPLAHYLEFGAAEGRGSAPPAPSQQPAAPDTIGLIRGLQADIAMIKEILAHHTRRVDDALGLAED